MNKIEVELIPKVGMNSIRFGMTKEEVRERMKKEFGTSKYETYQENTEGYFEYSLRFTYEENGTLSFIETCAPPPIFVTLLGHKTWEIPGDELMKKLNEIDEFNPDISESGINPIYKNQIIALYDLKEQYHHVGNQDVPKWGSISIGDERYYKNICDIYGITD